MTSIIKFLTPTLPELCNYYKSQLQYANKEAKWLANYYHVVSKYSIEYNFHNNSMTCEDRLKWSNTLAKLIPQNYMNGSIPYKSLIKQHNSQVIFYNRIKDEIDPINFETDINTSQGMIYNYACFLEMCYETKNVIIIPTLLEDFVWHSHMQDNDEYVKNMTKIFGRVLGHDNETDFKHHEKKSNEIRNSYYISKSDNHRPGTGSCGIMIDQQIINQHYANCSITSPSPTSSCSSCSSSSCSSSSSSSCGSSCGGD